MFDEQWTSVKEKKVKQVVMDPKKNEDFHRLFKDVPETEILADGEWRYPRATFLL